MKKLLFIDTNILLDFYRSRTEAGLSLLKHVNAIRAYLVTTHQVEMEFMKNRQSEIRESFSVLKPPPAVSWPLLLSETETVKAIKKDFQNIEKRIAILRQELRDVFIKPTTHDPVYKIVQGIFSKQGEFNLTREHPP
jgi:hypothetical protein